MRRVSVHRHFRVKKMRRVRTPEDFAAARALLGMTMTQLAAALRIPSPDRSGYTTISAYEKGKRGIPGPTTVAMEALLADFRPAGFEGKKNA